ncbi:hypothetical protein HBA54_23645 [Pelagibius litoralis]|uniref:CARDB domain-containing protein n=1 Tax=Pelagibius litoralis TaxID=374515 RepID=A0A967F292_9PROT|nr:CARDB domain-containing protein [Pelagibius litoralis]NIA71590.1 hypothetical protein [Pelagibius litoralis]
MRIHLVPGRLVPGLLASASLTALLAVAGASQAAAQADLVPIVTAPMSASVGVQNMGDTPAPASHLTISCTKFGKVSGGCPDVPELGVYENPAFPDVGTVEVPELAPGEIFNHDLTVWAAIVWPVGNYVFNVTADAGGVVAESNEANNTTQTSYTQLPAPAVVEQPPLPLQATPGKRPSRNQAPVKAIVAQIALPDLMSTSLGTYIGGDHSLWNQVQTVRTGQIAQKQLGRNKDECLVPAKVRVMNIGNADSKTFAISVFDDGKLRTTKTASLKKGKAKWVEYDLRLNEGTNKVMVRIDPKNQVAEENEKNNTYYTTVEVPFDCDGVAVLQPQGKATIVVPKQREMKKFIPQRRTEPRRPAK